MIKKYKLLPLSQYHYVNQSECREVPDVNDAEEFKIMIQCMKNVKFTDNEIREVLDCVVAILYIGNVEFAERDQEVGPSYGTKQYLMDCSKILAVDLGTLVNALTKKSSKIGGELIVQSLSAPQAYQARDTFAKHLYGNLFTWIVNKVNSAINLSDESANKKKNLTFIGLLDIFGFEIFL